MTTRRQVLGAGVAVGAWVIPTVMVAKPVGASVSAEPGFPTSTPPSGVQQQPEARTTSATAGPPLAYTGEDLERDAIVGASLVAGGWVIHKWAAR